MILNTTSNYFTLSSRIHETHSLDLLSLNHISDLKKISIVIQKNFPREISFNKFKEELKNLHEKSKKEGLELFDEKARENAYKVLDFLLKKTLFSDFYIYPDDEKAIAIDYSYPIEEAAGKGLLILCDSEGAYSYYKTYNHKNTDYETKDFNNFCNKLKEAFFEFEVLDVQSTSTTKSENFIYSSSYYPPKSHQNVA